MLNKIIIDFLEEIAIYQSNNYGNYPKQNLVAAYMLLPDKIKKYLFPKTHKKLWRGCDGISEESAISFTDNRGYAKIFGHYVIPFGELKSNSGLIDTEKVLRLALKVNLNKDVPIGDDEGEVIVILPKWNVKLDLEKYVAI